MMSLAFTNPRLHAVIPNWPLGGKRRGPCVFLVEKDPKGKRGVRVSRTTTGAPKYSTYADAAAIVDGDDGRTYFLTYSKAYGCVGVSRSDFKNAEQASERDYATRARFAELLDLIQAANFRDNVDLLRKALGRQDDEPWV